MPVRPSPTVIRCPACHWSQVFAPNSDAIPPGTLLAQCPKCGNQALEHKPAGVLKQLLAVFVQRIGSL